MRRLHCLLIALLCSVSAYGQAAKVSRLSDADVKKAQQEIMRKLGKRPEFFLPWKSEAARSVLLERVVLAADRSRLSLYCDASLVQIAIRTELLEEWGEWVREKLGEDYEETEVKFFAYGIPAEFFIPNYYRDKEDRDGKRSSTPIRRPALVRQVGSEYTRGLSGRHIALWGGHGWYYEGEDSTWKWQRPALFGTREDLNNAEYVTRFLGPMLENAGAVVVMARERDPQWREIIVDNDRCTPGAELDIRGDWKTVPGGFRMIDTLDTQNPFRSGTALQTTLTADARPMAHYQPGITQPGEYGVYVSWKALSTNITNARYTVYHAGGRAEFDVNQQIRGGTWVWLGSFVLGRNSSIVLSAPAGTSSGTLTADAVKIGGGVGNIRRGDSISGATRYAEAARYWMQYSGISDTVYAQDTRATKNNAPSDYMDNYKGNGDWVNYVRRRQNIPIDMALGVHTDAGICDSIIGTLSIHYTNRTKNNYTNGKSKMAGRDLADLVQTQIMDDIRARYDTSWTRRSMFDKSYAEISRPDMPAMLIEMYSHQNANDMALGQDPAFKFDMSRAIYKGVLRFLADRYGMPYVVQPLPPSGLKAELLPGDSVRISWVVTCDPLEPTARPTHYKIYRRSGVEGAFDSGTEVQGLQHIDLPLAPDGRLYSCRVTAVNEGGESFPSETVSVGRARHEQGVALVVNGFNRVSPPALKRDKTGKILGFDVAADPGVGYIVDRALIGVQHDFDPKSKFEDNDNPGWGASSQEYSPDGLYGNDFDYAARHGEALLSAGYSVVSCSREAFTESRILFSDYDLVDVLMGAQRSYPERYRVFGTDMLRSLRRVVETGVPLILSGSYIASDPSCTPEVQALLGFTLERKLPNRYFKLRPDIYYTPSVDGIRPVAEGDSYAFRTLPPGVRSGSVTVFGWPIEQLDLGRRIELFTTLLNDTL